MGGAGECGLRELGLWVWVRLGGGCLVLIFCEIFRLYGAKFWNCDAGGSDFGNVWNGDVGLRSDRSRIGEFKEEVVW